MQYNADLRGTSLSKCYSHFRMCSATPTLAAATPSVPALRSRFGPTKSPASERFRAAPEPLPRAVAGDCRAERLSEWPRAPSSIAVPAPGLQLCDEDPGAAAESRLQLLRPQVTTVARYSPASKPQNSQSSREPHDEF